jgi:hypothetical protein
VWPVVLAVVLIAGAAQWRGTVATMTGQVANPSNRFATAALYAPSSLTATPSGHNVNLSWPAGTNGSGYAVQGAANGSSSSCASATFSPLGTATGTSYTDAGRYAPQGTYFCYRVATTYGSTWTSQQSNPVTSAQIGFVATSVAISNGGAAGSVDTGDRIVVAFNQAVDTSTGPTASSTVCASTLGIFLGSTTTSGGCVSGETLTVGTLSGVSVSVTDRWNASYTWSTDSRTLTIVLGTRTSGLINPILTGSWTFTPTTTSTNLLSSSGHFHVCDSNSGGGLCVSTATGSF